MAKKKKQKKLFEGDVIEASPEVRAFFPDYNHRFKRALEAKQRELELELENFVTEHKFEWFEVVLKNHPELKDYHWSYREQSSHIIVLEKKDKSKLM